MALTMVMMMTMLMMMTIANNEQDTILSFEEQDDYVDISRHYFLQAWIMDKLEDRKTKVVVVESSLANITLITLFKIIIMIIPTINTITITATLINISTKVVVVDSSLANQSLSLNSGEVLKVKFTKMWFRAIMFSLTLILVATISNSSFRTMFPGSECSPCVKF